MTTWLTGKVAETKQWSPELFSLKIRTKQLNFQAGQFVNIGLEINGKIISRPYSLVNSPQDSLLEIHFNNVTNGNLSPKLADLIVNDVIQVSDHANGLLILDEVPVVSNLWLLATGTGIGPFLSILKTTQPWSRFRKIVLLYSVKTLNMFAYHADIEALKLQHPEQFIFASLITREEITNTINARITNSIKNGVIEEYTQLILSPESNHIMLCGNSKMISEVSAELENRGFRRHTRREPGQIAIEKYY